MVIFSLILVQSAWPVWAADPARAEIKACVQGYLPNCNVIKGPDSPKFKDAVKMIKAEKKKLRIVSTECEPSILINLVENENSAWLKVCSKDCTDKEWSEWAKLLR